MICSKCHNQIEDGSQFCLYCGSRQEPVSQWPVEQNIWNETPPATGYQQYQPVYAASRCPQCGNEMDANARFCGICGWNAAGTAPAVPQYQPYTAKAAKPGMNKGMIIGIVAAALVLVVLVAGLITGWFGSSGPVMTIAKAAEKTLESGNFTVEFEMDDGYDRIDGVAWVDIDKKKRTVNVLMELEVDHEQGTLAIYDGYLILVSDGYYEYTDISDAIDEIFDAMEETDTSDPDWEELLDRIDPYLYRDMEEYIDFDKLNGCIKTYVKKLNSASWMKENAGYSTENKNGVKFHILEPEMDKFIPASVACMEDAFQDPDDFEDLMDEMDDLEDVSDEIAVMAAFGIKGGKLTALEVEMEIDGDELTVEAEFSDIGKTKLDPGDLEDLLDEAKDFDW